MKLDIKNLKFKPPALLRAKDSLGIDLGSSSIKIVQISGRKVVRWAYKALDHNDPSTETNGTDRSAALAQMLTEFLSENKKAPRAGVISVSGNSVIVRYVKLPKLSRADLEQTIQFEAEPYIPFAI